ncbi:MAG TPA: hypothetical protein VNM90_11640 [Haliangium sp.]|nr:hypothetical protein [Haliangium sp.]
MKKHNTNGAATKTKLKLARETLRQLGASDLKVVQGGTTGDVCQTIYPCRPPDP